METARISNISAKVNAGVAACAIAAAATLTPAVVAQADVAPAPLAPVTDVIAGPVFTTIDLSTELPWWLLNDSNSTLVEPGETIFSFTPLAFIPPFLEPAFRALTAGIDFELRAFGYVLRIGAYGATSLSRAS